MQAVATCEFLLAPALCSPDAVDDYFLSLAQLHSDLMNSSFPPLLEDDAYQKLVASDRFPTDRVFSRNFKEGDVSVFSVQDITTIVNKILVDAKSLSEVDCYWIQEWKDLTLEPSFTGVSAPRAEELTEFFSTLALLPIAGMAEPCALHYEQDMKSEVRVQGELIEAFPLNAELPIDVNSSVKVFGAYKRFLADVPSGLWLGAQVGNYDFKLALFAAALKQIISADHCADGFNFDSFTVGLDFIPSMERNQSGVNGAFFQVVFDTVVALISGMPKNEVSPFRVSENSEVQRVSSDKNMRAYRTHITKSGLALRLMFWKADDGRILLANIGPKNECRISE